MPTSDDMMCHDWETDITIGMAEGIEMDENFRAHQLSPSSWNRYEQCPRKYWLSRQKLPRKASMPASLGNAVHNSVEDICNLDLNGRDTDESGWMTPTAKAILDRHWKIERESFLATPRHPRWKEELITQAHDGLVGALNILCGKSNLSTTKLSELTIGDWRHVQSIVLANEGTLVSDCGRLMGRLDLLVADLDSAGQSKGWIVADLKTGRPPIGVLDPKVSRQLRFYRDLIKRNNPDHPKIRAEGWYSANQTIHEATGPNVIDDAFVAWEGMRPTNIPLEGTPEEFACGFCEWKAWCPDWWLAIADGTIAGNGTFRDEVVRIIRYDSDGGAGLLERMAPVDEKGAVAPSPKRFGFTVKDQAKHQLDGLMEDGYEGALFMGSARATSKVLHLGDWSEILPWQPLLESTTLNQETAS